MTEEVLFELKHLRCSYDKHYRESLSRVVLEIEHLSLPRGKKIFIVGESGIGKSTILETLGMMNNTIVPDESTCFMFNDESKMKDLKAMWKQGDKTLSDFRLKNYSFIFQSTNLMKNFTAFENVAFTRMLQGYSKFSSFQQAKKVLADLGLEHVDEQRMAQELSGGQQQRLSFARAILPSFTVLFGDEPTGNLDAENAVRVMTVLDGKLKEHAGASAIIVSHKDIELLDTPGILWPKLEDQEQAHVLAAFSSIKEEILNRDDIAYGYIDDRCVYTQTNGQWTNGNENYTSTEFEVYLRKK